MCLLCLLLKSIKPIQFHSKGKHASGPKNKVYMRLHTM